MHNVASVAPGGCGRAVDCPAGKLCTNLPAMHKAAGSAHQAVSNRQVYARFIPTARTRLYTAARRVWYLYSARFSTQSTTPIINTVILKRIK